MKFNLEFIIRVVYGIFKVRIPGLAILVPLDALLQIARSIQVGMANPIKVEWRFGDIEGLMKFLKELMDAAVEKTETETLQAIYHLMCYLTDLENYLTEEEFVAKARDAADLLPARDVFPDQDKEEPCAPPLPS